MKTVMFFRWVILGKDFSRIPSEYSYSASLMTGVKRQELVKKNTPRMQSKHRIIELIYN